MSTTQLAIVASLLASGALLQGCSNVECAEGTIEQNGTCVPSTFNPDDGNCGAGTVLGDTGMCEPELPPTLCGDNTVADETTVPGTIICVGTGGAGCSSSLPCPSATGGKVTVCGRLFDVETDVRLEGTGAGGMECGSGSEVTEGPCQLEIDFYDAIAFASSPTTATPQPIENFTLDDCGRYVAQNITRPASGFLGIGVDDGMGEPDEHRQTGVAFPVAANQQINGERSYIVLNTTDEDWAADVGFGANTFVDRGVFMPIYLHGPDPVAGVVITRSGSPNTTDDYYFTDITPTLRTEVVPDGATGPNGAGLFLNTSGILNHGGTGGEPSGCVWEDAQAATIAGVLFISRREAAATGGGDCP